MATLGRWTGGVIGTMQPGTSWAAPNALFPTQARNDSSTYTWTSSTSTIQLPSSGLATGYLVRAMVETEDSSNGRYNIQGRFIQSGGTGNFLSAQTSGYSRDTSEDRAFLQVWAILDNPSASATIQFQWKRDTDAPGATDGTVISCIEVIPLEYSDISLYSDTTAALLGGTTPNQVDIDGTTVVEGTNITMGTNVITVTGDNKRYLIFASVYGEGFSGGTRTQRIIALEYDGTTNDETRSYMYCRNAANDNNGAVISDIIETVTASRTIELNCWRGDGVGAFQGGADQDGATPSVAFNAIAVIELNDSAEVIRTNDATASQEIALTGPVDLNICRTGGIDFNDSASFTREADTGINAVVAMDAWTWSNISAYQGTVASGSRFTCRGHITVNGTEDNNTRHGNYQRNAQSTSDTFGWAVQPAGFLALSSGDDIGVSCQEITGTEGGNGDVETQYVGTYVINLDTLDSATAYEMNAEAGSYAIAGVATNLGYGRVFNAESSSYAITGIDTNLGYGRVVNVVAGTYGITGQTLERTEGIPFNAAAGSYGISGTITTLFADRELNAESGSYVLTGVAADLDVGEVVNAAPGTYAITGADTGLARGYTLNAEPGSYSITGSDTNLGYDRVVNAAAGVYGVTGQTLERASGVPLNAEPGSYTINGIVVGLEFGYVVNIEPGTYGITGVATDLDRGYMFNAEPGTYAVTGVATDLDLSYVFNAEPGSYVVTGADTNLAVGYVIDAEPTSYAITGVDTNLARGRVLDAVAGVYGLTGQTIERTEGVPLNVVAGSYTITGAATTLERNLIVDAEAGVYTVTGAAATLETLGEFELNAEPGTYAVSGVATTLVVARTVNAVAGNYTAIGAAADLDRGFVLNAELGGYTIAGNTATTIAVRTLNSVAGSYSIIGADTTLEILGAFELDAEPGVYLVTGVSTVLERGLVVNAVAGVYSIVGVDGTLLFGIEFNAEAGSYNLAGVSAELVYNIVLNAYPGAYVLTGSLASLSSGVITLVGSPGQTIFVSEKINVIKLTPVRIITLGK
jgi:hypothetical protein